MQPKRTGYNHEKIIREALRRELESASTPPSEQIWAGIRAGLAQENKESAAPLTRCLPWRRLAAAAALLILFVGGGLALNRSGLLTMPGLLKGDFAQLEATEEEVAEMSSDAEAVSRPLTLGGGFTLEKAGDEGLFKTEDHYPAAVYRRGKERLLWICASSPSTDLWEFIAELSRQLEIEIEILDEVSINGCQNSILEFTAGERPGIAWQEEGGAQAFLTLSGSPDLHALIPGVSPDP